MKLYHVKTQADYDALMQELEKQGCRWIRTRKKPTETNVFPYHRSKTVIKELDRGTLVFDNKNYYTRKGYSESDFIEYTAKEKKRMKDKEWLKEEIKDEIQALLNLSKVNYFDFQQAKDNIEKTIDQLEEPKRGDKMLSQALYDGEEKIKRKLSLSAHAERIMNDVFTEMYNELEEPKITEEQAWEVIGEAYADSEKGRLMNAKKILDSGLKMQGIINTVRYELNKNNDKRTFQEFILDLIKETEKPVIPQFVADAMSKYKDLRDMLTEEYYNESTEEVDDDTLFCWIDDNFEMLCRAWQNDYVVEKEERFYLKCTAPALKNSSFVYLNYYCNENEVELNENVSFDSIVVFTDSLLKKYKLDETGFERVPVEEEAE